MPSHDADPCRSGVLRFVAVTIEREWASFLADDGQRWLIDLTFLASGWQCVFGCGCQGVLTEAAPELEQGCCSYGAHFVDDQDMARVVARAAELLAPEWQFAAAGRRSGIAARLPGGGHRTRLVDGACIFLNRPNWAGGAGCALHVGAMRAGREPMEDKPDVCWQVPLRRSWRTEEDGTNTAVLTEFGRSGWGEGGQEFAWWCTEAPEAFTGTRPVYRSLEPELRAILGNSLYERVAAHLDARQDRTAGLAGHPTVSPGENRNGTPVRLVSRPGRPS